jgi:hypothetical protein
MTGASPVLLDLILILRSDQPNFQYKKPDVLVLSRGSGIACVGWSTLSTSRASVPDNHYGVWIRLKVLVKKVFVCL